jgi:hypothetical protein
MNNVDLGSSSFEIVERFLGVSDRLLKFTSVSRESDNGVHTYDLAELLKRTCPEQWERNQ